MPETLTSPQEKRWSVFHCVCAFLLFVYFMVYPVHYFLWRSIKSSYYLIFVPIYVAFYYYFRGFKGSIEVKLLTLFYIWLFITRLLNGDKCLQKDFEYFFDMSLCSVFLPVGFLMDSSRREKFMTWLAAVLGTFFSLLGAVGIYAFVKRTVVINPITEGSIGVESADQFSRLNMLDHNPNISAMWFFMAFCCMLYLFFRYKNKWWLRIPIALAALIDYAALAITYSRNTMGSFSICITLLVMLLIFKYMPFRKKWLQVTVLTCAVIIMLPLTYKSFDGVTGMLAKVSASMLNSQEHTAPKETASVSSAPASAGLPAQSPALQGGDEPDVDTLFDDPRDLKAGLSTFSGRTEIYKSTLYVLKVEPQRLIRGCISYEAVDPALEILPKTYAHFHNSFIQVLMIAGLPGLLIVLAFCVLLVIRMIRVFFSTDPRATLAVKSLTFLLAGVLSYNLLETSLFYFIDTRSLFFFLVAGIFLAYSYEILPPLKRGKSKANI